jgi:hypothetical protein
MSFCRLLGMFVGGLALLEQQLRPEQTLGCRLTPFDKALYVNAKITDDLKREIATKTGATRVQTVRSGDRQISNLRAGRLIIKVSTSGLIISLSCT